MKILLKRNHRLFNYQQEFGATLDFLPTLDVSAGFLDVQPIGDVSCTVYTADKVKSADTGKRYDHQWLWTQMVQAGKTSRFGASPQDAFSMAVKGQRVVPTGEIDDSDSYYQTDIGQYDFFTNVKSSIQLEFNKGRKRSQGVGTWWYQEWMYLQPNSVMPEGKTKVSAHEYEICGWDAEHPDCFKIDYHQGHYIYMPKDVFNKAMDAIYGSVALTLAETAEERIQYLKDMRNSLWQSVLDYLYNIVQIVQSKIYSIKPVSDIPKDTYQEVKDSLKENKIVQWAEAIERWEGDTQGTNPGNLKYTSLTASWGAKQGRKALDGGYFAIFDTYDKGFEALCKFLTLGCKDELKAFHQARTLKKFMEVYAGNPPQNYIYGIIKELGCSADTDISTFL